MDWQAGLPASHGLEFMLVCIFLDAQVIKVLKLPLGNLDFDAGSWFTWFTCVPNDQKDTCIGFECMYR